MLWYAYHQSWHHMNSFDKVAGREARYITPKTLPLPTIREGFFLAQQGRASVQFQVLRKNNR